MKHLYALLALLSLMMLSACTAPFDSSVPPNPFARIQVVFNT